MCRSRGPHGHMELDGQREDRVDVGAVLWFEEGNDLLRDVLEPWKWLVVGGWMLMVGFTIAFIGTSVGENEIVAAQKGGIMFSVVCIVTGAVAWRLLQIGRVRAAADSEAGNGDGTDEGAEEPGGDEEA